MGHVVIRLDLSPKGRIGPGKIALLEQIGAHGSISAAGRVLGMSYRRAWILVEELNRMFAAPVVTAQPGGPGGGGASLTMLGASLVESYRAIEAEAQAKAEDRLAALEAALSPTPSRP
jgi:molybdate transport system regulatory protein